MVTMKEALRSEIKKVIARIIRIETCEVVDVQLHMSPDDKKMNTVDVQLRDSTGLTDCQAIVRYRVPNFLPHIGHLFGLTWQPVVGDLVQVLFLSNEKAYVISPYYNQEQKPVCRQNEDDKVIKFCKTPARVYEVNQNCKGKLMAKYLSEGMLPGAAAEKAQNNAMKHLKRFENPDHPVCMKYYGKDRSFIFVSDCPLGHGHPDCEQCTDLEDINNKSNSVKFYPYDHPKHPNRIRISHKKGQTIQFEDDGSILIQDSQGNFICLQGDANEQGIVIKDKAGSFIGLNGHGTLTVHAASNGSHNLFTPCGYSPNPNGYDEMDKTEKQKDGGSGGSDGCGCS